MKKYIVTALLTALFIGANKEVPAQIFDRPPSDGLFADDGILDKAPIPFPSIRRADVMWSKRVWREIDFRQKMNQPFYFPINSHNNWRSFINVILDGLKLGDITAYAISPTDELLSPIGYQEIIDQIEYERIETLTRAEPPYEQYDTVIRETFDPTKVMRLRIKEDWYFDKQRSQLMVRIIALCPVMMVERNNQEFPQPLFWVSYENARPTLAKAAVFNRNNSAERRTYDEIFWKRLFDSYVYKEDNVYDRAINDYMTGLDAMLESERIKMEMFQFEHDLWEY
jgi:gliding motility associated protien GldN